MKRMQRLGGKMMKRSADQADVGAVIAEFKTTDEMLDRLIKDFKEWRASWEDILKYQHDASQGLVTLYEPIEPTKDPEMTRVPAKTPPQFMQKCTALQKTHADLQADLAQELNMITKSIISPLEQAKLQTKAMHRTLKHRENTKLDYERYLGRAEHARKKEIRTQREEVALVKHESDLAQSQIDYQTADDQVKQTFPPLIDAVLSLLPILLANQVMLQTNLAGQFYTVMDAYCRQYGLPSPAPSDADIIRTWEGEFSSFRKEMEGDLQIIARGKVTHQPMTMPDKDKGTVTGLGIRNKVFNRTPTNQTAPIRPTTGYRQASSGSGSLPTIHREDYREEEEEAAPPRPPRPGDNSAPLSPPISNPASNRPRIASYGSQSQALSSQKSAGIHSASSYANHQAGYGGSQPSSGNATPPSSRYLTPTNGGSPAASAASLVSGGTNDYFSAAQAREQQQRRPSATSLASSVASIAAAKKKPPPPVPAKRLPSAQQSLFVTALYDFDGQNSGDLAFREGDRIRVVKKTDSTDDWWDGELHGRTGAFPANYVQS